MDLPGYRCISQSIDGSSRVQMDLPGYRCIFEGTDVSSTVQMNLPGYRWINLQDKASIPRSNTEILPFQINNIEASQWPAGTADLKIKMGGIFPLCKTEI
ncbi:hypothetical protein AVEN_169040-1 [Araneus ventricosus]|uniref:Uncharacterized protein n=1 Tax=Araneus ventricosus TaxID=182803 RepID=A0A4Y2H2C6_ARAVE|nr:hypothetical protein AVEN_169040-1 [Araneus ventricosus]